jgi:hypothetical protein
LKPNKTEKLRVDVLDRLNANLSNFSSELSMLTSAHSEFQDDLFDETEDKTEWGMSFTAFLAFAAADAIVKNVVRRSLEGISP